MFPYMKGKSVFNHFYQVKTQQIVLYFRSQTMSYLRKLGFIKIYSIRLHGLPSALIIRIDLDSISINYVYVSRYVETYYLDGMI